jgi:hypothetical protein
MIWNDEGSEGYFHSSHLSSIPGLRERMGSNSMDRSLRLLLMHRCKVGYVSCLPRYAYITIAALKCSKIGSSPA